MLGEPPAPLDPSEVLIFHAGRLAFRRLDVTIAPTRARTLSPREAFTPRACVKHGFIGGRN